MTVPPFTFTPNPESLIAAAVEIRQLREVRSVRAHELAAAAISAYMEAEHEAGRAKEGRGYTTSYYWHADEGMTVTVPGDFPVLILRLSVGEK